MTYTEGSTTMNIVSLVDYNANVITTYIPQYNYCTKTAVPIQLNLKTIFNEINDPNGGYIEYVGPVTVPWTGKQAIGYEINPLTPGEPEQAAYANPTTGALEWVYNDSDKALVNLNGGFVPKTFTDADFTITAAACQNAVVNPASSVRQTLFF